MEDTATLEEPGLDAVPASGPPRTFTYLIRPSAHSRYDRVDTAVGALASRAKAIKLALIELRPSNAGACGLNALWCSCLPTPESASARWPHCESDAWT